MATEGKSGGSISARWQQEIWSLIVDQPWTKTHRPQRYTRSTSTLSRFPKALESEPHNEARILSPPPERERAKASVVPQPIRYVLVNSGGNGNRRALDPSNPVNDLPNVAVCTNLHPHSSSSKLGQLFILVQQYLFISRELNFTPQPSARSQQINAVA